MKKKNLLGLDDYIRTIGIHLLILLIIYLLSNSTTNIIIFELINIIISFIILILRNAIIECRLKRKAKCELRLEEFKEQFKDDQNQ